MRILADIALFAWIPVILLLFTILPPRRAVIVAFLAGWCFLPVYGLAIKGFPEYDKQSATCLGILLAAAAFDGARFVKLKPRLLDLPMALWCISPLISNTLGERGAYEGMSTSVQYIFAWGIPYFIGRLYITDLGSMRELAVGLFVAGLVYSVFTLYEIKMSPQLHTMVYGFFPHENFTMTRRWGGWRPNVFMQHGLAVGLFMSTCAVVGIWLWKGKSLRVMWGMPAWLLAMALAAVSILCKSTGATMLMLLGVGVLWITARLRTGWALRALLLAPVAYMVARTVGGWDGQIMVDLANAIDADRGGSLHWRLASESESWRLVRPKALFGMGYFAFAGQFVEGSDIRVTPDGMWLIALVANGLFGLFAFYGSLLLPVADFARRLRPVYWGHPAVAPAASVAIIVVLFAIDNLFNAMANPILVLAAGGLVSTAPTIPRTARLRRPPARMMGEEGAPGAREEGEFEHG